MFSQLRRRPVSSVSCRDGATCEADILKPYPWLKFSPGSSKFRPGWPKYRPGLRKSFLKDWPLGAVTNSASLRLFPVPGPALLMTTLLV